MDDLCRTLYLWDTIAARLKADGQIDKIEVGSLEFGLATTCKKASLGNRTVTIHYHYADKSISSVLMRWIDGDDRGMLPMPATAANTVKSFAWLLDDDDGH